MEQSIPQIHHLSGKKTIIAGAGMAGLSFAIAMYKQWPAISTAPPPTFICYERDTTQDIISREGYSLSLRSDAPGGIQALQKLGILDAMVEASIKDVAEKDGGFCVWDKNWKEIIKLRARVPPSLPVGSLRIARKNLRSVLIKAAVAAGLEILWGVACVSVAHDDGSSGLTVGLSSGANETCDMLIAADGASSKLRAQLRPSDTLQFQHIVCMGGTAVYPPGESPPSPVDRDWGIMPLNEKHSAMFFSPVGPNTALWSLSFRSETPAEVQKPPVSDGVAKAVLKEVQGHSTNFPTLFQELVNRTDKDSIMVFNARDKQAFAHNASTIGAFAPHVVFLGDANHAVSPFAGNGANMALCDGWDLAEQLLKSASVEEAVKKYDNIVVPRANKVVKQSHIAIAIGHSQGWRLYLAMLFLKFVKFILLRYYVR